MKIELISHHLCPYVQRAAITLLEKGVDFERVDIDLSNKPDWFKAISPLGKTPLLRVDGRDVIFESAVICEYLDETQAPTLHPSDALSRARHRGWIEFASSTLSDIAALYNAPDAVTFDRKLDDLRAKFRRLEDVLGHGPYFTGTEFSLVDAAFAPVFRYLDTLDLIVGLPILDGLPKTSAWWSSLRDRPSVRQAVDADYSQRLTEFLRHRGSHLSRIMPSNGHGQ